MNNIKLTKFRKKNVTDCYNYATSTDDKIYKIYTLADINIVNNIINGNFNSTFIKITKDKKLVPPMYTPIDNHFIDFTETIDLYKKRIAYVKQNKNDDDIYDLLNGDLTYYLLLKKYMIDHPIGDDYDFNTFMKWINTFDLSALGIDSYKTGFEKFKDLINKYNELQYPPEFIDFVDFILYDDINNTTKQYALVDDILDYNANQKNFGKDIGDDFFEGKVTLPIIFLYQSANNIDKEFIKKKFIDNIQNNNRNIQEFNEILKLINHYQSLDFCK